MTRLIDNPNAHHAVLIDPLMPAHTVVVVGPEIEPDRLHELIFGQNENWRPE